MISSNILPNILSKKFISLLSEKSLKKKTLDTLHDASVMEVFFGDDYLAGHHTDHSWD
jgi:hypothetical protein